MTTATAKLADQVPSLPCEDRIYLVDRLLQSLNAPSREEIDRLWAEEAERRIEKLDSEKVEAIPGEQVFAEIRERLARSLRDHSPNTALSQCVESNLTQGPSVPDQAFPVRRDLPRPSQRRPHPHRSSSTLASPSGVLARSPGR
jgi:putative addiction module component (TIGR02574 family)